MCRVWFYSIFIFALTIVTRSDSVLNKCSPSGSLCTLTLENTSPHKFSHHIRQRCAPTDVDRRIHSYKGHGFIHHRHSNPRSYHNFNHRPYHFFHHRPCIHPWNNPFHRLQERHRHHYHRPCHSYYNQWPKPSTVTTSIPSPVTETTPQTTITNTPPYIPNVSTGNPDFTTTEETSKSTVTEPAITSSTQYKPAPPTPDITTIETTDGTEIEKKDNNELESTTVQTETNKVTEAKVDSTENGILTTTEDTNTKKPTTKDTNTEEPTTEDINTEGPTTEDINTEGPTTEALRIDPLFEEMSTYVEKMCDKVRLYCNNKTSHMFSDYTHTINIPLEDYDEEAFEIKTQHRVLSIVGVNREKTEEYSELIILERAVNTKKALWSYKNNKLEIVFSSRETDNSCDSFIDNSVQKIPKEFIPIYY